MLTKDMPANGDATAAAVVVDETEEFSA